MLDDMLRDETSRPNLHQLRRCGEKQSTRTCQGIYLPCITTVMVPTTNTMSQCIDIYRVWAMAGYGIGVL